MVWAPRKASGVARAAAKARGPRRRADGVAAGDQAWALIVEAKIEPTTWLLVTGWNATQVERNLLDQTR